MSQIPTLDNATDSLKALYRVARVLGAINQFERSKEPNHLEQTLRVEPFGLGTGRLPSGHEVTLDLKRLEVRADGTHLALHGHSQRSILKAILTATRIAPDLDAFTAGLEANGVKMDAADLLDTSPLQIEARAATDYANVLWRVFTAISRFRARLTGPMTRVAVWPHGFDLSTLWFATPTALESAPHMNYGFAPFDRAGNAAYLYAYAYPMPDGFERLPLPDGALWNMSGWNGVIVPYAEILSQDDPEAFIENTFLAIHGMFQPTLNP